MSAPQMCDCRFCGDSFGADGITNHETWCDENPHRGTPVEQQKQLGILEDSEPETGSGNSPPDADPDQRASADGGSLPPRDTLPSSDKATRSSEAETSLNKCRNCGSENTIPTQKARRGFEEELGTPLPDELKTTLDATERYCNDCWHVWGGPLQDAHPIHEEAADA